MGFSEEQKRFVVSELQTAGWMLEEEVICAPSEGFWLGDSHFEYWGPEKMHEIIGNRGRRIARARHEGWEQHSEEHAQVCQAIEKMWEAGL